MGAGEPAKGPAQPAENRQMTDTPLATLYQSLDQHRPATLEALLAGVSLLLPILDAIPNAAIFIKDPAARYVLANNTLVQRCGLKRLQPLQALWPQAPATAAGQDQRRSVPGTAGPRLHRTGPPGA